MSEYKNTLNLPTTDFPMKANLAQREPEILKQWEAGKIYEKLRAARRGKKRFILPDGPPYANGHIHLGHAVNKVLKDIVIKAQSLNGYDVPFIPGWDCHGLPIEINVEKKLGKPGHKVSATEFRAACREYALSQVNLQREDFKRLGVLGDWEHPYLTMDHAYEAGVIRALSRIIEKGYLQKGYKPVYWCLDCSSALADAEVEYANKKSPAIDVRFVVVDEKDFLARITGVQSGTGAITIPIWTTTPWSLPGNEAVALSANIDYVLVACQAERLLIAESLLSSALMRYGYTEHHVLGRAKGEAFVGVKLQHPFYDRVVSVILGEHVTTDAGTGAVHIAPAHGLEDFALGQQCGLPLENPVGDSGCYLPTVPLFAGIHVSKANEKIIAVLKEKQHLLHEENITHSYPHCWRHKTPIIYRATPQWFIGMDQKPLRAMALAAIERVQWIPDWGKARITAMIESRPDWCISRQRVWGVPLALFIHKDTGEMHPQTLQLMEKVAERVAAGGIEAWHALEPEELLGQDAALYRKNLDVLDVWLESGMVHSCVLSTRPELGFPADLFLEGSDQHRGWFQSSLLTALAMVDKEPFATVLTHGFVVDGQGRKMSKSLGNGIEPQEIIDSLGADILRLWIASTDYRNDINTSKEIFTRVTETYRRIRNTARFLLANLHDFNPQQHLVAIDDMLQLDRFALAKAGLLQEEIITAYNNYQFHLVCQKLHNFCVNDLGGFYLDVIKDRQYTMPKDSLGRRSAQTAMYHIAQAFVRWLAPILSFTAEEIGHYLPGEKSESVFLSTWYETLPSLAKNSLPSMSAWETICAVRNAVNKEIENQRNAGLVGSSLEAQVYLYCNLPLKSILDTLGEELRFVFITSVARVFLDNMEVTDAAATEVPGLLVKVVPSIRAKCERCWHRREDVGIAPEHPGLCGRCVSNVDGPGEKRHFA